VDGLDPVEHRRTLLRRLGNPGIRDPLARLCARGSTKMPSYLLPSLAEAREQGRGATLLTLAVAAWFQYLRTADHVEDAQATRLRDLAGTRGHDPRPLLSLRSVFGTLGEDTALVAALESAWCSLDLVGPHATVREHLAPDLVDAA
jgi:fructuronate reductase/mannitol 2-dehydrogenase